MPRLPLTTQHRRDLLASIDKGRCILFLGPHAACGPDGLTLEDEMEQRLREEFGELAKPEMSLAHLSLLCNAMSMQELRDAMVQRVSDLREAGSTGVCHDRLAQMPFSLIIQTTPDPFMENALRRSRASVQTQTYNYRGKNDTVLADAGTKDNPLIYYLRGTADPWESMPLTAEEDINHLVALVREQPELPPALTAVLRNSGREQQCTALFLGFDFAAWQTRMLLHGLLSTGRSTVIKPRPTALATHTSGRNRAIAAAAAAAAAEAPGAAPSELDEEFLWTSYNLIFAADSPAKFAEDLFQDWSARQAQLAAAKGAGAVVVAVRKISRGAMRKLLGTTLPEAIWKDLVFENADFEQQFGETALRYEERSEGAGRLIKWIEERNNGSLEPLMKQLQAVEPARYAEYEAQLLSPAAVPAGAGAGALAAA